MHTETGRCMPNQPSNPNAGEAPLTMLIPAVSLALMIVLVGIFNQFIVNQVIRFTIPPGF